MVQANGVLAITSTSFSLLPADVTVTPRTFSMEKVKKNFKLDIFELVAKSVAKQAIGEENERCESFTKTILDEVCLSKKLKTG